MWYNLNVINFKEISKMTKFSTFIKNVVFQNSASTNFIRKRTDIIDQKLKLEDELIMEIYGFSFFGWHIFIITTRRVHYFSAYNFNIFNFNEINIKPYSRLLYNIEFTENNKKKSVSVCKAYEITKEEINESALKTFSDFAESKNFVNYSFVEVFRSNVAYLPPGSYVYNFDGDGNINLLKTPYKLFNDVAHYYAKLEGDIISIYKDSIRTYKQQGTEMMMSTVSSSDPNKGPGLVSTMFSELLFGTSYSILKGMKQMQTSISTTHTIKDTRHVQIILNDNTDIVFQGISFIYDISRFFVKDEIQQVSGKEDIDLETVKEMPEKSMAEKLREIKELLDDEIITEEEFKLLKEDIINNR